MMHPIITGLDIGHYSIKTLSLRLKKGQLELIGCHEVLLPESVFMDGNILNVEELKPFLSHLKKQLPSSQKRIAFSMPDSSIISKVVQIDNKLDEKEVEFAIGHTFEQQSSFSAEDLNVDYVALEGGDVNTLQTKTYQVFATRKDLVQSRQICLESSGFKPVLADVHSNSLGILWKHAVSVDENKRNWMLVDIGHMQTVFCIVSPTDFSYSKNITFGAASSQKENDQPAFSHNESHLDSDYLHQMVEHIQRQITLYSSIHNHTIDGIWLTGGGSLNASLREKLNEEMSVPVEELNLLDLVNTKKKKALIKTSQTNQYAVAFGLALSGAKWLTR